MSRRPLPPLSMPPTPMRRTRRPALLGLLLVGLSVTGLTACADDFLTENPPDELVADNLYVDLTGFEAGLNALYAQVRLERYGLDGANDLTGTMWVVGTDNGWVNYDYNISRPFSDWGPLVNPLYSDFNTVFVRMYRTINAANTIINRAENPDVDWTEADKNRVVAEARLFRAWAYRHLTYLWGDVPLNTEEAAGSTIRTDWERAPLNEVLAFVEADLLFASQYLPVEADLDGKLTKAVADHYLAEHYLRVDDPAKAEQYTQDVIAGPYRLVTERYGDQDYPDGCAFMDQFRDGNASRSQGNTESLWTLQLEFEVPGGGENIMRRWWVNRYYSNRGLQVSPEFGGRGLGRIAITAWALDLYEEDDDRGFACAIRRDYPYNDPGNLPSGAALGDTLAMTYAGSRETSGARTSDWPSTRKWDWTDDVDLDGARQYGDQPYLRLAETYLLLAEAQLKQGNTTGAAEAINTLRRRANASEITPDDVTLGFILDERSRELVTEEHRRYTLLRTGTWLSRTRLYNNQAGPNITERDRLFPIPQPVIDANLTTPMEQNPGY